MQKPDNIKLAGMALAVFLLLAGWIAGLFLLVSNYRLSFIEIAALFFVEVILYIVGGLILYIFTEK